MESKTITTPNLWCHRSEDENRARSEPIKSEILTHNWRKSIRAAGLVRVALSSVASLDYWQQSSAEREERARKRLGRDPCHSPTQPQPGHTCIADGLVFPKTEEGKRRTEEAACAERTARVTPGQERAERLRSSPPGARTQVRAKLRACGFFFYRLFVYFLFLLFWGAGWLCVFTLPESIWNLCKTNRAQCRSLQQRSARWLQMRIQ